MKKYVVMLILFTLAGCSSNPPKKENSASSGISADSSLEVKASTSAELNLEKEDVTSPAVEKEKPKVVVPVQASQYEAINEAVRNQNDDKLFTAATQILTQTPTDVRALNAMAMYNYKKGRFDAAKYLLNKAISVNPRASELYSNLGIVQLALKERREATKSLRRAIELNASDGVAAANLGAIYVQEKDFQKGLMAMEIAYKNKNIRDVKVLNNYGLALAGTRQFEKAAEIYQTALKDGTNNKEVLLNYSILLIEDQAKFTEGLDVLNRLKFVGVSPESRNRINALENKAKAGVK